MLKTATEQIVKQGIVSSVLANSTYPKGQLENLYEFLLNDETLVKIKPYNLIRNLDNITEYTGVFRLWLVTKGKVEDDDDIYTAGKRVVRALERMSKEYKNILPEGLKGSNSLMTMLRVFYMPSSFTLTANFEVRQTMSFVSCLLRTMLILDLIFNTQGDINGHSQDYWLGKLISNSKYDVDRLAIEVAQRGGTLNVR